MKFSPAIRTRHTSRCDIIMSSQLGFNRKILQTSLSFIPRHKHGVWNLAQLFFLLSPARRRHVFAHVRILVKFIHAKTLCQLMIWRENCMRFPQDSASKLSLVRRSAIGNVFWRKHVRSQNCLKFYIFWVVLGYFSFT